MKRWKALALAGVGLVGAAALTSSSAVLAAPKDNNVTLVWWNNANQGAGKALWAQVAKEFEASHPGVTIQEVPLQNEQFTTKIPLALQSNDPPDVFQNWGGGGLVDQVKAGKVADVTKYVSSWIKNIGGVCRRMAGRRQAVRDPVQPRRRRVLVRQGSLREGGDHVSAEDVAPVHRRRQEAEDGGHHADRDRKQGSLAGCLLLGLLRDEALQQGDDAAFGGHVQLQGSMLAQGRSVHAAADRHATVPGRLPRHARSAGRDELGRAARQRQGGNGAAGALEPWRDPAAHPGQQDPELPRVVPVPERARQQGHSRLAARRRGRLRLLVEGATAGVRAVPELHRQPERPEAHRPHELRAARAQGHRELGEGSKPEVVLGFRSASPFIQLYLDQAYSAAIGQALDNAIADQFAGKATPAQVVGKIAGAAKQK